ncbi:MAG TPA: DUF2567 domain-containing protein, partial [Micromonosporaceae bacterium]|nr:DUF2567 domain-containing protein [Micromonosporaceae bacterium]
VYGVLLAQALAAAVGYTLLAGWSGHPALRPAPQPEELRGPAGPPGPAQPGPELSDPEPPGPALSSPELLSWDSTARQAPTAAPAPPVPGAAEPPRD